MHSRNHIVQTGRIIALLVFFLLGLTSPARSLTVAVFPMEDLSRGYNSVNFELTMYLQQELAAEDFSVVDPEAVIAFMGRNRIRWLGYLDSAHIRAAKEELQADLVLLGTVSQRQETRSPSFGLTLNLVRTEDARPVWSASGGLSLMDMQRLLGINEPATLDELWPVLVRDLMARLSAEYVALPQQSVPKGEEVATLSGLAVSHVALEPRFVQPGEEVKCSIELTPLARGDELPQVFVNVGTRIHLARRTEEGLFYEANWTGSDVEQNIFREVGHDSGLNFASRELEARMFEGLWPSAAEDDQYPVNLILRWPSGRHETLFVGAYTVDSTPPDFDLKLIGREIDRLVTFHDKLVMLANFREREPTSRWRIRIEGINGRTVLEQEAEGRLPHRFGWHGQDKNGLLVPDGIYLIVLEAWDRSGNMTRVAREVAYRSKPPEITLEVTQKEDRLSVKLLKAEGLPIQFWQFELWSGEGELLKMTDGRDLPVEYDIALPSGSDAADIKGVVFMKDIIGNKNKLRIQDFYLIAMHDATPGDENKPAAAEAGGMVDDWTSM